VGREPFFDPVSVSRSDLPASHLVFPEHLKYDQTQKAPYAALLDRLRAFC
jgi:hypothetical protein